MPDPLVIQRNEKRIQDEQEAAKYQNAIVEKALKKRKRRPVKRSWDALRSFTDEQLQGMCKASNLPNLVQAVQHNATYGTDALAGLPTAQTSSVRTDVGNGWNDSKLPGR